jgi:hypothetical protein
VLAIASFAESSFASDVTALASVVGLGPLSLEQPAAATEAPIPTTTTT